MIAITGFLSAYGGILFPTTLLVFLIVSLIAEEPLSKKGGEREKTGGDLEEENRTAAAIVLSALIAVSLARLAQQEDCFVHQFFHPPIVHELENLKDIYNSVDDKHKPEIVPLIFKRVEGYDESKLPADLQEFLGRLRREYPTK